MVAVDVSIIIPVLDDYARLTECLACLNAQTFDMRRVEVIVADNGTAPERVPDLSEAFAELCVVQVREETPGSYAARNAALTVARGEALAFTDADCLPEPEWLEEGMARLGDLSDAGLVGGAIEVFVRDPRHISLAEAWEVARAFPQEHYVRDLHFAATANAFTTQAVVEAVGGFAAGLKSGGDRDLGERIWQAGWPVVFAERAMVKHPARHDMIALLRKTRRTTRGDWRRTQLREPMTRMQRAEQACRAGRDLALLPGHLARALTQADGSAGARLRFALAETAVHATRRATILGQALQSGAPAASGEDDA